MDLTGWLEYFITGLDTQLAEVKERGRQAIRVDVMAQEHGLNERQVAALRHLIANQTLTIQDYEGICPDHARRTLQRDLADLRTKGVIVEFGQAATDPNRRYRLAMDL